MKTETFSALIVVLLLLLAYGLAGRDDRKTAEIAARNMPTYKENALKKAQEREEAAALALFEIPLSNKKRGNK